MWLRQQRRDRSEWQRILHADPIGNGGAIPGDGSNGPNVLKVTFTTIFPGCYAGRWPHIHFEIFDSLAASTNLANRIRTSQLAFPESACRVAYAVNGYATSLTNLNGVTLASDNVFGEDRAANQLATMTGDVNGYTATLTVAV